MKKYIGAFFVTILAFLLQTSVFERISFANTTPNLLLAVTTAYAFMYGKKEGMFTGFISGLLVDVLYNKVIGVSIILYCTIGYFNGSTKKLFFKEDIYVPAIVFGISDLVFNFMYYICYYLMRGKVGIFSYTYTVIIPEAFYTIIAGYILYYLMKFFDKKFGKANKYPINLSVFEEENKEL